MFPFRYKVVEIGEEFGRITSFTVKSDDDDMVYVHDFEDYWARRPSVHLFLYYARGAVEWFYNEVMVPLHNDVIGSYYMANGFREDISVCNATRRRSEDPFSVWSPSERRIPS